MDEPPVGETCETTSPDKVAAGFALGHALHDLALAGQVLESVVPSFSEVGSDGGGDPLSVNWVEGGVFVGDGGYSTSVELPPD
jgi:hypothetical protein